MQGGTEMRLAQLFLAAAFAVGTCHLAQSQPAEHIAKLPNEVEFKAPLRPGGPAGAVLYGDPSKPGVYVNRVRFEPGFKVAPHFHAEERVLVVVSGTLYFGLGETWDESKMKPYPAGTFFTEPPGVRHFTWAKDGEVTLHITGVGPSKTTLIEKK